MHGSILRSHPLYVGAALSVIVCSLVAAAAITGLIPNALSRRSAELPGAPLAATPACSNCGTVQAIRQLQPGVERDARKATAWRITVRMDDASYRTVSHAAPPALAVGDKVRVLDGRAIALK